jgi:hypothetical protein
MRPAQASLILTAALALVPLASFARGRAQDPVTPPDVKRDAKQDDKTKTPGIGGFLDDERERVIQSLEGVWLLMRFDPPHDLFDSRNVQGVLMIRDGYLSLNLMAQQFGQELFGDGVQLFVQGGAHRYRIDEFGRLQTSAIMSFHNFDAEDSFTVEASGASREYVVALDETGDTLKLTKSDGSVLTWIRLKQTEYPEETSLYGVPDAGTDKSVNR